MGLLIGGSAISIIEVIDLFLYNFFRKCCRLRSKIRGQRKVKSTHTSRGVLCVHETKFMGVENGGFVYSNQRLQDV